MLNKGLLYLSILFPFVLKAQSENVEILAKYIITEGEYNGQDVTSTLINAGAQTIFYTMANDETLYLANVWVKDDTFSYGPMSNISSDKIEATEELYEADIFYFDWHYTNSYDEKTGTAAVEAITIHKPDETYFIIEITDHESDKTIYRGYLDVSQTEVSTNTSTTTEFSIFRKDYTLVSIYESKTNTWSDWKEGNNTFVINYNDNGDIAHYKPNGDFVIYKNISGVEEDTTESGESYQILNALDEDGTRFSFQLFNNPKIGVKLIYKDIIIQFANN